VDTLQHAAGKPNVAITSAQVHAIIMVSSRDRRGRLDADTWRRMCAVLDRIADADRPLPPGVLEEACRSEGVRVEDFRTYLEAADQSDQFPGRVDPAILESALLALAGDAPSTRLAPGTRLGPYEIVSLIGAGGMGEVYRARDTRLNRLVALKRLTAHMAASPEGRKRFEREAHITSTLNHPHICTLHDVGEHEGVEFLVMEFIEGETLAARLRRGPLPMIDALRCAAQMADALAAAHRQGIVHRDLKPANIMLTAHGVKLLDFGLAALRTSRALVEGSHDAGTTTAAGMILGTLQYMAPEQLQGKQVDGQADIFAVGAILYEMLNGRRAFDADNSAGVVAAVLNHSPKPLRQDRPDTPAPLDWVVAQCLTKTAEERWQSAADLGRHLRWIEASCAVTDPEPEVRSVSHAAFGWLSAAALALVAALAIAHFVLLPRQGSQLAYRFEIRPPMGTSYEGLVAVSRDGRRLAFAAADAAGLRSLWIRPLEGLTAQRIEATEGALHPFWSPDGGSVGFFADRKLKVVDLRTRAVRILSDTGNGGGGTWNADGVILFADDASVTSRWSPIGLRRVSASGGVATSAVRLAAPKDTVRAYPQFLPDGRRYLFTQLGVGEAGIYVGRLEADEARRILPALVTELTPQRMNVHGPVRAIYSAGHLFYLDGSDRALIAQAFDIGRLQLTGDGVRVAEELENSAPGLSAYDVSATGMLAYRPSPPEGSNSVMTARAYLASAEDQKFLMPSLEPPVPAPLIVLTNWPSLVKP
jgi:serine/threonine protein kinase